MLGIYKCYCYFFFQKFQNVLIHSGYKTFGSLVEETRVPGENHRPVILSHNVVSSTTRLRLSGIRTKR